MSRAADRASGGQAQADAAVAQRRRGIRLLVATLVVVGFDVAIVLTVADATAKGTASAGLVWGVFTTVAAAAAAGAGYLMWRWQRAARSGRRSGRAPGLVALAGPVGAGAGLVLAQVLPTVGFAAVLAVVLGVFVVFAGVCGWAGYLNLSARAARGHRDARVPSAG